MTDASTNGRVALVDEAPECTLDPELSEFIDVLSRELVRDAIVKAGLMAPIAGLALAQAYALTARVAGIDLDNVIEQARNAYASTDDEAVAGLRSLIEALS